jgi:spore germination cell wall hydrolase CwlJ-like protein
VDTLEQLDDLSLLTALVMGEAEAEPFLGKIAVACVVKNRLDDNRWPDTWQEVMLQPWQFSCFNTALLRPEITMEHWGRIAWKECRFAAFGVLGGYVKDVTEGSNHYYAGWMNKAPSWARGERMIVSIGDHLFYRL